MDETCSWTINVLCLMASISAEILSKWFVDCGAMSVYCYQKAVCFNVPPVVLVTLPLVFSCAVFIILLSCKLKLRIIMCTICLLYFCSPRWCGKKRARKRGMKKGGKIWEWN